MEFLYSSIYIIEIIYIRIVIVKLRSVMNIDLVNQNYFSTGIPTPHLYF